jgi:methylenetetrahydrofolate dehydrogenase (NADP+) / methenyltetrahydrofolate cyclohydrolase
LTAKILDGLAAAAYLKSRLTNAASELIKKGIRPCLATVLVGDDQSSSLYVRNKQRAASEVGIITRDHKLPSSCTEAELIELIRLLNRDIQIHGILVQLPLPPQIDQFLILRLIDPKKDVDGLTPHNAGLLMTGNAVLLPCTPAGIIELLDYNKVQISGKDAIVINRSALVGKPLGILLLERDATVTICHSRTRSIAEKLKRADILVTAVGNRREFLLTVDMIKPDSVIVDVGINKLDGRIAGDVDFESVKEKASWITPVPGGVGPMTISMLLKNTITAASIE